MGNYYVEGILFFICFLNVSVICEIEFRILYYDCFCVSIKYLMIVFLRNSLFGFLRILVIFELEFWEILICYIV